MTGLCARPAAGTPPRGSAPRPSTPPAHDARDLTGGANIALILLDGVAYTLRITRQGKLLLTK